MEPTAPPGPVVTRPTLAQLLTLAWPVVITRSAQVVVGFTDAAMVARLGEKALAATTAGATNAFTILILPMGMVFIVSSFSSQLTGKGDAAGARRYGFYGLATVSYTHLDGLTRSGRLPTGAGTVGARSGLPGSSSDCLLYTSRCV